MMSAGDDLLARRLQYPRSRSGLPHKRPYLPVVNVPHSREHVALQPVEVGQVSVGEGGACVLRLGLPTVFHAERGRLGPAPSENLLNEMEGPVNSRRESGGRDDLAVVNVALVVYDLRLRRELRELVNGVVDGRRRQPVEQSRLGEYERAVADRHDVRRVSRAVLNPLDELRVVNLFEDAAAGDEKYVGARAVIEGVVGCHLLAEDGRDGRGGLRDRVDLEARLAEDFPGA